MSYVLQLHKCYQEKYYLYSLFFVLFIYLNVYTIALYIINNKKIKKNKHQLLFLFTIL